MKSTICVILIFTFFTTTAQKNFVEGYIIYHSGESHDVLIADVNVDKNLECVVKESGESKTYQPGDILGYGYSELDQYFESGVVEGKFAEVIYSGAISLFRFKNVYYIVKGEEEPIMLQKKYESRDLEESYGRWIREDGTWKGLLKYYTADCKDYDPTRIETMSLNEQNLLEILTEYSICKNVQGHEFKANLKRFQISPGIVGGLSFSQLHLSYSSSSYNYLNDTYSDNGGSYGFFLEMSLPRSMNKIKYWHELSISKASFSSSNSYRGAFSDESHDATFELKYWTFLTSFKLDLRRRKSHNYFIQLGFNNDFQYDSYTNVNSTYTFPTSVVEEEEEVFEVSKYQPGLFVGVGYKQKLNKIKVGARVSGIISGGLNSSIYQDVVAGNNRMQVQLILMKI